MSSSNHEKLQTEEERFFNFFLPDQAYPRKQLCERVIRLNQIDVNSTLDGSTGPR